MSVLIVDYGMGNISSARRAFEECGARVRVSDDPAAINDADRLVIPGVGAFPRAMQRLRERGWVEQILHAAREDGLPILGICLGMQLLADEGTEVEPTQGLGLIRGNVERIVPEQKGERVPHVGWNSVRQKRASPVFDDIPDSTDFYFVHSYRFVASNPGDIIATTPFAGETTAVVGYGAVIGTQFHPEKSSRPGFQLLRNFLALKAGAC